MARILSHQDFAPLDSEEAEINQYHETCALNTPCFNEEYGRTGPASRHGSRKATERASHNPCYSESGRGANQDRGQCGRWLRDENLAQCLTNERSENEAPIKVLQLNRELLLQTASRRMGYNVLHFTARILPATVIYGGTLGLCVCAVYSYRWGVLLSLTLYSLYSFHLCLAFCVFSTVGMVRVWLACREHWHALYCRRQEKQLRFQAHSFNTSYTDGLAWHDVIHVVMVPCYKTPDAVLDDTIASISKFSLAATNMGICFALEEREHGIEQKAAMLKAKYEKEFRFVMTTFHPANLPNHVPGKSSNECWAFQELQRELQEQQQLSCFDTRVVVTVIDDDSDLHSNYFEALTYYYLTAPEDSRYLTTWQAPIVHFKNYLRQPVLVRISSLFATLSELAFLANPMDCHVNYSSYSLSLVLASAVGGWDPDYLAEDWHMYAKCSLMTGGRIRCHPIFLPILNYTPEEDSYWGSMISRWTQAKRHALGVNEIVYVITSTYLGLLEMRSWKLRIIYLWRLAPLLGKFSQVHFVNGMSAVLNVLAQIVIHFYMWSSWCSSIDKSGEACKLAMSSATQHGIAEEQIVINSWMVFWQQRLTAVMAALGILSGGMGAFYFHLVKDRVEGNVDAKWWLRHPLSHWVVVEIEVAFFGLVSSLVYGAAPLWIAVFRIVREVKFKHVVAGMVGRSDDVAEM